MKNLLFLTILLLACAVTSQAQIVRRETARGFSFSEALSVTLANSTTETTIYSSPVKGGSMGDVKQVDFRLVMVMNSILSVPTLTIKIKFGGQTMTLLSAVGLNINLTNRPLVITGYIRNVSPTSQKVYAKIDQSGILSSITGIPSEYAEWTVDTTADQTFGITAQFGSISTSTTLAAKDLDVNAN